MFLDSPDKILSLGRFEPGSPDNILSLVIPTLSPRTSRSVRARKCLTLRTVFRPRINDPSSVRTLPLHPFLVKLEFDLTLTFLVVWTWVDVPRSVNEVLNRTSFGIEFTSWFNIDRQSRSTSRLRMVTCLFSVLSVTVNRWMVSIHSRSCLSTSLSSKSRSFPMKSGATFTLLFSRAMLFIPSLVSPCCTRLDQTSRFKGTGSHLANTFVSAAVSTGS